MAQGPGTEIRVSIRGTLTEIGVTQLTGPKAQAVRKKGDRHRSQARRSQSPFAARQAVAVQLRHSYAGSPIESHTHPRKKKHRKLKYCKSPMETLSCLAICSRSDAVGLLGRAGVTHQSDALGRGGLHPPDKKCHSRPNCVTPMLFAICDAQWISGSLVTLAGMTPGASAPSSRPGWAGLVGMPPGVGLGANFRHPSCRRRVRPVPMGWRRTASGRARGDDPPGVTGRAPGGAEPQPCHPSRADP